MSERKIVDIIGAGAGGIATAIKLAENGFKVRIFEKSSFPGGRCGQISRDGHKFDIGATIFLMPSIYRRVFDSLGLNIDDYLESIPLPVIYKLHFADGTVIDFSSDLSRMDQQLDKIEHGSPEKLRSYISKGYDMFQTGMDELLGKNYYSWKDFITLKNLGLLFKLKAHKNHFKYAGKFFKDSHLKAAFTFQNIYVGQNPYSAPALFSMLPAAELTEGSVALKGGMFSVIEKLASTAEKLGVEFFYNKAVSKIIISDKKVAGLVFEDGSRILSDIVVANADLPYVYRDLLPDKSKSRHIDNLEYSCSAISFHWAVDKVYPQLSNHSIFLSGQFRENLDMIFKENSISGEPSFYVHTSVREDPSAAPENQDSISIIVPVGHLVKKGGPDWENLKSSVRDSVIKRLQKEGLEDIEKHIKFEISSTPETWNTYYNISKGSVFGSVSHKITQMCYFRPHNKHGKYRNLYFVGGSTHPGNGVPLVLLSSMLTSERILKDTVSVK